MLFLNKIRDMGDILLKYKKYKCYFTKEDRRF